MYSFSEELDALITRAKNMGVSLDYMIVEMEGAVAGLVAESEESDD